MAKRLETRCRHGQLFYGLKRGQQELPTLITRYARSAVTERLIEEFAAVLVHDVSREQEQLISVRMTVVGVDFEMTIRGQPSLPCSSIEVVVEIFAERVEVEHESLVQSNVRERTGDLYSCSRDGWLCDPKIAVNAGISPFLVDDFGPQDPLTALDLNDRSHRNWRPRLGQGQPKAATQIALLVEVPAEIEGVPERCSVKRESALANDFTEKRLVPATFCFGQLV